MAFVPDELAEYHDYHAALNNFAWLLKATLTARDDLKRKRFRLDRMLQCYIREHVPDSVVLAGALASPKLTMDRAAALASLQKVWYNELAFCTPPLVDPLLLDAKGVQINIEASTTRLMFPSWKITQAYYTVYHALRTLVDLRGVPYHKQRHTASARAFKSAMLAPASRGLLAFPFTLVAATANDPAWSLSRLPADKAYLRFNYADHPRYRRNSSYWGQPGQSFEDTVGLFTGALAERASARADGEVYMLPDLLRDLRNWGSYVDIDNMIALKGSGFRAYLDQDLHTVAFFYAALAELAAIALCGPDVVVGTATEFHQEFIETEPALWRSPARLAMDIRFTIYAHLGRLGTFTWHPPPAPPLASPVELR